MDETSQSYRRMSAQLDWLLDQRGASEQAVAEAIRAALVDTPIGPEFPRGSHENVILRLACVLGMRAPFLDPLCLITTPLALSAVSEGQARLLDTLALVQALEGREPQRSELRDRCRAFLGDHVPDIETLWSAEGSELRPRLRALRARMLTEEGTALLDDATAAVAALTAERLSNGQAATFDFPLPDPLLARRLADALAARGLSPAEFCSRLRRTAAGDGAAHRDLLASGLPADLLAAAGDALYASLGPEERFVAYSAMVCGNFDHGVDSGAITAQLLGQFLLDLFSAITTRAPLPQLGPPHLLDPQQWLCDLFVDAVNADTATLRHVEQRCEQIARREGTVKELGAELARRVIAAKGVAQAFADAEARAGSASRLGARPAW